MTCINAFICIDTISLCGQFHWVCVKHSCGFRIYLNCHSEHPSHNVGLFDTTKKSRHSVDLCLNNYFLFSPYTEYEFGVLAVNNVGRGPKSTPVLATTGETSN